MYTEFQCMKMALAIEQQCIVVQHNRLRLGRPAWMLEYQTAKALVVYGTNFWKITMLSLSLSFFLSSPFCPAFLKTHSLSFDLRIALAHIMKFYSEPLI